MGNVNCVCGGSWEEIRRKKQKKKNQERKESPDVIKENNNKFSLKKQYTSTVNPSISVVSFCNAFLGAVSVSRKVSPVLLLSVLRKVALRSALRWLLTVPVCFNVILLLKIYDFMRYKSFGSNTSPKNPVLITSNLLLIIPTLPREICHVVI